MCRWFASIITTSGFIEDRESVALTGQAVNADAMFIVLLINDRLVGIIGVLDLPLTAL